MVKKLIEKIKIMKESLELDNLYFSFLTSDEIEYLLPYIKEIEEELKDSGITMFNHFAGQHVYKDGVIEENKNINKLDNILKTIQNNKISRILFADDSNYNQFFVSVLINKKFPHIKVISFMPNIESINVENILKNNPLYSSNEKRLKGLIETIDYYNFDLKNNKERR